MEIVIYKYITWEWGNRNIFWVTKHRYDRVLKTVPGRAIISTIDISLEDYNLLLQEEDELLLHCLIKKYA